MWWCFDKVKIVNTRFLNQWISERVDNAHNEYDKNKLFIIFQNMCDEVFCYVNTDDNNCNILLYF